MSDNLDNLSVERVTLNRLLGNPKKCFQIPHYQRKYAWDKDNCAALMDDILAVADGRPTHFFSNLTLSPLAKADSYYVVDGQQRLTTLSLFIEALKQSLRDPEVELDGYLKVGDFLKLSFEDQVDQRTYRHLLLGHFCEPESLSENMVDNFIFLKDKVEAAKSELRTAFDNGIFGRLLFVRVVLPEKMPPQRIFERMNGTKLPATPLDLIKNFLLMKAKTPEDEQEVYGRLEDQLPAWSNEIWILVSMHAMHAVSEDHIFKVFKSFYEQTWKEDVVHFVSDLNLWVREFSNVAGIFADLNGGNWGMGAQGLGRFGPLLMKIATAFSTSENKTRRDSLISYFVESRRSWIANYRLNAPKIQKQSWDARECYRCLKSVKDSKQSNENDSLWTAVTSHFEIYPPEGVRASFENWVNLEPQHRCSRNMDIIGLGDLCQAKDITAEQLVKAFNQSFEDNKKNLGIEGV